MAGTQATGSRQPHDFPEPTSDAIALDGISLTVNGVEGDRFSALIIPHTLKATTLGSYAIGDAVNLEVDLMARYAARLMEKP